MTSPVVLLVDDIPDHIEPYAVAFRARGFHVAVADTGGDAIAIARATRPACVVIDERLSDMRGWELCRSMKDDALLMETPVVMLAQELTMAAVARGQRVGCDAWLARPTWADDLVRAVEDVIASGAPQPPSLSAALVGFSTCAACTSPRIRGGVRIGPVQYYTCADCGLRWRVEADGQATA